MNRKHCQMDLAEVIRGLVERQHAALAEVREMGRELTPVEEARFSVGVRMIMDLLIDLRELERSWESDQAAYRVTELAMENDTTG